MAFFRLFRIFVFANGVDQKREYRSDVAMYVVGILLIIVLGVLILKFGFGILLALFEFLLNNIFWVIVLIFILILIF